MASTQAINNMMDMFNEYVKTFNEFMNENEHDWDYFMGFWNEAENQDLLREHIQNTMPKAPKAAKTSSGKKIKDPNAPKGALSAYILFCNDNRAKVVESAPQGTKATEITKMLGQQWKALTSSNKAKDKQKVEEYNQRAAKDRQRFNDEMAQYVRPSDEELLAAKEEEKAAKKAAKEKAKGSSDKKLKTKRDPNKPAAPRTAWLYFCDENREAFKAKMEEASGKEIQAALSMAWAEIKEAKGQEFEKYEKKAVADKKRYEQEMKDYVPPEPTEEEEQQVPKKSKAKAVPKKKKPVEEIEEDPDATNVDEDPDATDVDEDPDCEVGKEEDELIAEEESPKKNKGKKAAPKSSSDKKSNGKKATSKSSSDKKVNAQQYFFKTFRPVAKEKNPEMKAAEITKMMTDMWKGMSKEQKAEWKERAENEN